MVVVLVLFICLLGKEEQGLITLTLWVYIVKSLSVLDRFGKHPSFQMSFCVERTEESLDIPYYY